MAVERSPGEKMYIDWVGDQPEILVDPRTGEIKKVHVFTTTLGVSSLVYAECLSKEDAADNLIRVCSKDIAAEFLAMTFCSETELQEW